MTENYHTKEFKEGYDVLVIGTSVAGKTTAGQYLIGNLTERDVPHDPNLTTDSSFLLKAMTDDDDQGGMHHSHPGYDEHPQHEKGIPLFPFTVTDSVLPTQMRVSFAKSIKDLSPTEHVHIVECAIGENLTGSPVDYSSILE